MPLKEPSLFDKFEHKGVWWFPNLPDARLPGVLTREDGDISLELFDAEGRLSSALNRAGLSFPYRDALILGQLEDGRLCTLDRAYETARPNNWVRFEKSIAKPHITFLGEHFPAPAEVRFRAVTVEFADLAAWMFDRSPLIREDVRDGQHFKAWQVTLGTPEATFADVPVIDTDIGFGFSTMSSGTLTKEEMSVTANVTLTPRTPQGYDWFLTTIRDLQNWLTLMIGSSIQPARIEASTVDYRWVDVMPFWMCKKRPEPISPVSVRVKLPAIRGEVEALLRAWFERSGNLRDVYNLFFGAVYAENVYVELQFLSLIQAVEAFSRTTTASTYITSEKYEGIRNALAQAIPEGTPSDLKDSLKNRIKYGNEFSLRKRLNELLKALDPDTLALVCRDRPGYVERVVATRNYLTHYTSELRAQAWHVGKLYRASESLKMLLTVLLLKEVGFGEQRIRDLMNAHSPSRQGIDLYLGEL